MLAVFVIAPLAQLPNECEKVVGTKQSTVELCVCTSALMFVKSLSVKESVTLHVIFEPLDIFCETLVSVAPLPILKFAFAVWYEPSSILYSTFT